MEGTKNVVVGTDFSEQADAAVREAARMAARIGARLLVLHAIDEMPGDARWVVFGVPPQDIAAALQHRADGLMATRLAALRQEEGQGIDIQSRIVFQKPSVAIVELAEELGDALIVIGRTGESLLERLLLGSTAERVLRTAPSQVLVIDAERPQGWKTIVAPVDFSPASETSLKAAASLAEATGATLHVLHAYEFAGLAQIASVTAISTTTTFQQEVEEQSRRQLEVLVERIGLQPGEATIALRVGLAAEEILLYSEEVGAELVVMGAVGRTGVRRLLLGNTAERVVRRCPCALLAVKSPAP